MAKKTENPSPEGDGTSKGSSPSQEAKAAAGEKSDAVQEAGEDDRDHCRPSAAPVKPPATGSWAPSRGKCPGTSEQPPAVTILQTSLGSQCMYVQKYACCFEDQTLEEARELMRRHRSIPTCRSWIKGPVTSSAIVACNERREDVASKGRRFILDWLASESPSLPEDLTESPAADFRVPRWLTTCCREFTRR